jgi:hypothetical protein
MQPKALYVVWVCDHPGCYEPVVRKVEGLREALADAPETEISCDAKHIPGVVDRQTTKWVEDVLKVAFNHVSRGVPLREGLGFRVIAKDWGGKLVLLPESDALVRGALMAHYPPDAADAIICAHHRALDQLKSDNGWVCEVDS